MADIKKSRQENQGVSFFVDSTCIDCGTCYWMAPATFQARNGQSAVIGDPADESSEKAALEALFSCPTNSIGQKKRSPLTAKVATSFPLPLSADQRVYHCGFHAETSFGAASYFLRLPEGNIMVDSPRFVSSLATAIESKGGLQYQFLTHKDDIADTDLYQQKFSSTRIIHQDDVEAATAHYELILHGQDIVTLPGHSQIKIIPVPGHTKGHCVLLLDSKYLFTGDHLAWSPRRGHLIAFKDACWFSWETQRSSMERLLEESFQVVLPGHGHPYVAESCEEMKRQLETCLRWMKGTSP